MAAIVVHVKQGPFGCSGSKPARQIASKFGKTGVLKLDSVLSGTRFELRLPNGPNKVFVSLTRHSIIQTRPVITRKLAFGQEMTRA